MNALQPRDARTRLIGERLNALERDLDSERYMAGTWPALAREARQLPRPDRLALAPDISRISNKLHARTVKHTMAFSTGLLLEAGLALLGGALLWVALHEHSTLAAVACALLWTMAFQPLVKVLVGRLVGIRYSYAYLLGPEPRFKMHYGTCVAASRPTRILFHLSGMLGSPVGAWLPTCFLGSGLPAASLFCWALLYLVITINVAPFALALLGIERLGPMRLSLGSAGTAALEIREAIGR